MILIGVTALMLEGAAAGWTIVALLAVFGLARSVCSVSYKDVLGKTVSKTTRGTATGTASSVAAAGVLAFGFLLSVAIIPLTVTSIAIALIVAGILWLAAGFAFTTIKEEPGANEVGGDGVSTAISQFSLLKDDPQLGRFIAVRGLLIATALAPPFLLALAGEVGGQSLSALGPFVIASALASMLSGYVWGRFADRSSRFVLISAAIMSGVILGAVGVNSFAETGLTKINWLMACALFVLIVSYQGVRLGRSTHLTDMLMRRNALPIRRSPTQQSAFYSFAAVYSAFLRTCSVHRPSSVCSRSCVSAP